MPDFKKILNDNFCFSVKSLSDTNQKQNISYIIRLPKLDECSQADILIEGKQTQPCFTEYINTKERSRTRNFTKISCNAYQFLKTVQISNIFRKQSDNLFLSLASTRPKENKQKKRNGYGFVKYDLVAKMSTHAKINSQM